MSAERREAIERELWPRNRPSQPGVWAVLDCAREPQVYLALLESRLEFRCLYSGSLPRALEMAAPHLVELLPGHRLTARLLDEGWGRSWGIFVRIDDPSNLRHHLRKFLRARDEHGRDLLFRYYDPRVLRAYLPTCRAEELRRLFGPVQSFLTEAADPRALLDFRLGPAGLATRRVALAGEQTGLPLPATG